MAGVSIPESGGGRGKKSLDAELPLVPFIDLLCSLISFLLMTAIWTMVARLPLQTGNTSVRQTPTAGPTVDLRVEVHEHGFTMVEDRTHETPIPCRQTACLEFSPGKRAVSSYDCEALLRRLREEKAAHPAQRNVALLTADHVPYQEMVSAMDTCLQAGLDGVSVSGTAL